MFAEKNLRISGFILMFTTAIRCIFPFWISIFLFIVFSKVDFPQPFGPIIDKKLFGFSLKFILLGKLSPKLRKATGRCA